MGAAYGNITPAGTGFTPSGRWCEGVTAARVNGDWIVYHGAYTSGYYGASRTSDLVNWTDITSQVSFPAGGKHGTIIEVPVAVVKNPTPTPDTPTSLQAAANHTDVPPSWAAATNATSYKIMQATQPGGPYVILYINGVEVARNESMTLSPPDLGGTTQNWIGRSQYAAGPYFNGKMDDFRIYAGALSAAEVTALAHPSNVPPAAPQNLNLSSGLDDVTLSRNAVSG